jgi:hypothetical protein
MSLRKHPPPIEEFSAKTDWKAWRDAEIKETQLRAIYGAGSRLL